MAELACRIVLEDEGPPRPICSEKLGFTNEVSGSLRRCWEKGPSARPSIDAVSACVEQAARTWVVGVPAFMLSSEAGVEQVMGLKEDQAKDSANRFNEVRSRPSCRVSGFDFPFKVLNQIGICQDLGRAYLKYLQRLCSASGVLQSSFTLTEGFDHIGGGGDRLRAVGLGMCIRRRTRGSQWRPKLSRPRPLIFLRTSTKSMAY